MNVAHNFSRLITAFLSLILLIGTSYGGLPPEVKKCLVKDNACIARTMEYILHTYPKGNPSFGLPSVEDIQLTNLLVSEAQKDAAIQLNLKFNKLHVHGLEQTLVTHVSGFELDPLKSKIFINYTVPEMMIKGNYEMTGKILVLPLNGKGEANISLKNLHVAFRVKLKLGELREGKQYVQLAKVKSIAEPEFLDIYMENLYDGNKELSDNLLEVMRENWRDVWSAVNSGVNNAMSVSTKMLMAPILQQLSYNELFQME